ncbi:hypothetical protein UF75_1666 [Desulfosporosinus sp. I2]|nr:hypothetical protein UF75_1666 [Desulfosporosinus sp. I2]
MLTKFNHNDKLKALIYPIQDYSKIAKRKALYIVAIIT